MKTMSRVLAAMLLTGAALSGRPPPPQTTPHTSLCCTPFRA
ncbi:hypothetical protein [Tessaracoccus coleopterorum]|nr:hypothetical protein [Tessaracoccus coleopterorum]